MNGSDEIAGVALHQQPRLLEVVGVRVVSQPILGSHQDDVDAPVILGQQASGVEQLLDNLTIWGELDGGVQAEFVHPEYQGFQKRFRRETCRDSDLQSSAWNSSR